MLKFAINASSPQNSNVFLRKLWCELNDIRPMGWNMYPHKDKNHITIGCSNFGEISFDYTHKGCIKNLYIDNDQEAEAIRRAVQNALVNCLSEYTVLIQLSTDRHIDLVTSTWGRCKLYSKNGTAYLLAGVKVYSAWDAEMFLPNKILLILSVLYEYTHRVFSIKDWKIAEHSFEAESTSLREYNYNWIESDECPATETGEIILPMECLRLLEYILDDESYNEDIELLLNSSNLLFTTQTTMNEINFPYASVKADIINSMVCSSFEPLSLILDKSTAQCSTCGNKIFSISAKIKKMCTHYFDDNLAKHITNAIYKNRSIFLHNGQPESTQRSNGVFFPQINQATGMIMFPHGNLRYEVFDYSTFLFRNIARDLFNKVLE